MPEPFIVNIAPSANAYKRLRTLFLESVLTHKYRIQLAEGICDGLLERSSFGTSEERDIIDEALNLYIGDRNRAIEELEKGIAEMDYLLHGEVPNGD